MISFLDCVSDVEEDNGDKDTKTFLDTIGNIKKFSQQANGYLDTMIKADENWFFGTLLKLFK